ncbi:MAG: insulinase family protein, partial [Crocinitomicaceae bacterium]|nr:insulinase family protein [Crocinitomicaceae bacterium]
MLNRTIEPALKEIDHIDFVAPKKYPISVRASLYHMKEVPNETSRFELYFDAGKCKGIDSIAGFVNGLLFSGTPDKNSIEINSQINALGGFLESGISVENSTISMYCLKENLIPILKIVLDAIQNVAFIEKEVNEYLADRKVGHNVSLEKVSFLAQREFQQRLFASNDIYSTALKMSDFETLTTEKLKNFHSDYYLNGLEKVVIVGDLTESDIDFIIESTKPFVNSKERSYATDLSNEPGSFNVPKEGALQCAIRIGRILFNKNHEDYLDFLILNTIFGDYFGSRLMSNIREDKGYTYGIGTLVAELNNTGYFMIATEVGKDVLEPTLKEIKFELNRLRTELVGEEELQLVRNYMLGQLLKSADGPYAMTDLFLSVEVHGKDLEFYNLALSKIQNITAERI